MQKEGIVSGRLEQWCSRGGPGMVRRPRVVGVRVCHGCRKIPTRIMGGVGVDICRGRWDWERDREKEVGDVKVGGRGR